MKAGRRFIDEDLNRSFTDPILNGSNDAIYEHKRAREIKLALGSKPSEENFIIDLHSTTSNMGLTVIITHSELFNFRAAAWVQKHLPQVKIIFTNQHTQLKKILNSLSNYGLAIEVGPIPNGVVRHDLLSDTEQMVHHLLDYIHQPGQSLQNSIEVYRVFDQMKNSKNSSNEINAFIHRDLQDTDFSALKSGMPILQSFHDQTTYYQGEECYPILINEAAYYHESVAFTLTRKETISLQ